jgi:type I restriction-modification system DNA methylase subunit
MKEARNAIPTAALLSKVVDKLDSVKMDDRDTKGDVYEYMLGKIASAGQNGQFRTPRHIIKLMVELTEPTPGDTICDPACGTCGFLIAAGEFLREKHPEILRDPKLRAHFHTSAFHGFDFDPTMLRIGSMNMILHGIESPVIEREIRSPKILRVRRSATVSSSPIRPSPARSITRLRRRTYNRSSRPRRRNCCFLRCSCGCSRSAGARR